MNEATLPQEQADPDEAIFAYIEPAQCFDGQPHSLTIQSSLIPSHGLIEMLFCTHCGLSYRLGGDFFWHPIPFLGVVDNDDMEDDDDSDDCKRPATHD